MPASFEARMNKRGTMDAPPIQYKQIFRLQPGETPNRWDRRIARAKEKARSMMSAGIHPARVVAHFESAEYAHEVEAEIIANMTHKSAKRIMASHKYRARDRYILYIRARREMFAETKRQRRAESAARRAARRRLSSVLRTERRKLIKKRRNAARAERRRERRAALTEARRKRVRAHRADVRRRLRERKAITRRRHAEARRARRLERARTIAQRRKIKKQAERAARRQEMQARLRLIRDARRHVRELGRRMKRWLYRQREFLIETINSRRYEREQEELRSIGRKKKPKVKQYRRRSMNHL